MGRRSRNRATTTAPPQGRAAGAARGGAAKGGGTGAAGAPAAKGGATRAAPDGEVPRRGDGRGTALDRLGSTRKTLALLLGGAVLVAVVALVGTVALGGALAPWVVLAAVVGASLALHAWAGGRLQNAALGDEDRLLQTMALGLLVLACGFALVAAIVLTLT